MKTEYIQVQWVAGSVSEARGIIQALLQEKLIACASFVPVVESLYSWKGEIEQAREVKVWMKSYAKHYNKIEKKILELHSYDVAEILAFEVVSISQEYKAWMKKSLSN